MSGFRKAWIFILQISAMTGCLILAIRIGEDNALRRIGLPAEEQENSRPGQMVLIPAGDFIMGSDRGREDEAPAHQVFLDAFWIDQYEVTNQEYLKFIEVNNLAPPRYWEDGCYPAGQATFPVVGVRWKDAQAYCDWAGKRLPTEAEWEKACRGTGGQIYPWGDHPDPRRINVSSPPESPHSKQWDDAWALLTNPQKGDLPTLQPVGSYPEGASPFGIYDLIGNASEWVADYYNWDGYWEINTDNPLVLEPRWNHVIRGSAWMMPYGSYLGGQDTNRCAARSSSHGDTRDARMGFRCAVSDY